MRYLQVLFPSITQKSVLHVFTIYEYLSTEIDEPNLNPIVKTNLQERANFSRLLYSILVLSRLSSHCNSTRKGTLMEKKKKRKRMKSSIGPEQSGSDGVNGELTKVRDVRTRKTEVMETITLEEFYVSTSTVS